MIGTIYKTEIFDKEHTHVGGKIYQSDFNTYGLSKDNLKGSTIAARIAKDFKWEEKILATKGRGE